MAGRIILRLTAASWLAAAATMANACEQTVGWFYTEPPAFAGYTFFAPNRSTATYLVDSYGRVVHTWPSDFQPGMAAYLLEGGEIMRAARIPGSLPILAGGVGGRVQRIAWDGTLLWDFLYSSSEHQQHHDIEVLPNGNVLVIAWELKTFAEAVAAGRDPALLAGGELWPDHIIEVQQTGPTTGAIVWEWHVWDHLIQDFDPSRDNFGVVADHPELVDLNYVNSNGPADWNHVNSVDHNGELDQILLSVPAFKEIWIIDHSTTTVEAAGHSGGNSGHGGDLLYRWGNPRTYGAGTVADQKLFHQHGAEWVPPGFPGEGHITIFNNGVNRPGPDYSSAEEIVPPLEPGGNYTLVPGAAYGPPAQLWIYTADNPTDMFGRIVGGVQRLPNGNTLICEGAHGFFVEVTPDSEEIWQYINPVVGNGAPVTQGDPVPGTPASSQNSTFRALRFAPGAPELAGLDLTPGDPIELYPPPGDYDGDGDRDEEDFACFSATFTGPCAAPACADPIYGSALGFGGDFDGDGDVDCDDWSEFVALWTGPPAAPPDFPACAPPNSFIRGDANQDGAIDLADAVAILAYLFISGPIGCAQSADTNDDEGTDVSDAVYLLMALFTGGPLPPPPYPDCGPDPTTGGLGCDGFGCP